MASRASFHHGLAAIACTIALTGGLLDTGPGAQPSATEVVNTSQTQGSVASPIKKPDVWSVAPGFAMEWGLPGRGPGRFFGSLSLSVDSDDNIYVAESDEIQVFDRDGRVLRSWECQPFSMCVDASGNVFVVQQVGAGEIDSQGFHRTPAQSSFRLQEFSSRGQLLSEHDIPIAAAFISAGTDGRLYIMDHERILRLGKDREIDKEYRLPTDSPSPGWVVARALHVDEDGSIFVLFSDGRLIKWNSIGGEIGRVSLEMLGSPDTLALVAMAPAPDGTIYAADSRHRIVRFAPDGRRLSWWGAHGRGPGQFDDSVYSLTCNRSGEVYVADPGNFRIQKFVSGAVTPSWTPKAPKILLHLAAPTRKNFCLPQLPADCSGLQSAGTCGPEGVAATVYVLVDRGCLRDIGLVRFGIDYGNGTSGASSDAQGLDILNWRSCATMQVVSSDSIPAAPDSSVSSFPGSSGHQYCLHLPRQPVALVASGWTDWPEPGSFVELGLNAEEQAAEGFLVAYAFQILAFSPDTLRITVAPDRGACRVTEGIWSVYGQKHEIDIERANLGWVVFSPGGTVEGYNPCQVQ